MNRRSTSISLAFALLFASHVASAQQAFGPPGEKASTPAPDRCSWSHLHCSYPQMVLALDGGVSHFTEGGPFTFDSGTGTITTTGSAWGVRVGVELLNWLAIDARYIGMFQHADDFLSVGGRRGLLTNAGALQARVTFPVPYIQPYIFVGGGIYSTTVTGNSTTTQLHGSTEFGMPMGVGIAVPVSQGVSLAVEANYHRLFGESFADNDDIGGGDPVTANAVLYFRF